MDQENPAPNLGQNDNKQAENAIPELSQTDRTASDGAAGRQRRAVNPVVVWLVAAVVALLAGGLGAAGVVVTGLVRPDANRAIVQNRGTIVLQESEVVADVAKKVSPSVVSIVAKSSNPYGATSQSAATGIIISQNGYVLTNKHVLPQDTTVQVILADGTVFDNVAIVGRDPLNDLAFLKINSSKPLTPATLADSSRVQIGQKVVAFGNALGQFQNTVTSGIISGIGRPVSASDGNNRVETLQDLFQTDAAINPGNSGGPLVNLQGEVIGVNTAVASKAQNIGFAIPINAAKGLIKTVLKDGKVARAYMGVNYLSINGEIAKQFNLPVSEGAYIYGAGQPAVVAGSPAEKAGLKEGDVITRVDGTDVTQRNGLASILSQYVPGDTVSLQVLRGGSILTIKVTLGVI